MVVQSTDLAVRLHTERETLDPDEAVSYEGVHIDAWWAREAAAKGEALQPDDIQSCRSRPLTVFAVDAPVMRGVGAVDLQGAYTRSSLEMLARKVLLIFGGADLLQSSSILSGLLGGGAFRNNRPLVLLLHLLLQPVTTDRPLLFHHPVFQAFGGHAVEDLEAGILHCADAMLDALQRRGVWTLGEALSEILAWQLCTSDHDGDLADDLEIWRRLCSLRPGAHDGDVAGEGALARPAGSSEEARV